jgi:DNA mismatch repair protein MutL
MTDIIKLLPDSVANQIAAGEVIQRPASAVKELLENAVDAGATQIDVVIKDSGKTLIMIIDNGCGMSVTDARMSFERHATSKISHADDLFSIRTKGFRGEALASIAAIAQVELKTKRTGDEWGTMVTIEGSDVTGQEICSCPEGTIISVKNLFYNVPARRNFLKSPQVELRHIMDEFFRVCLIHPEIGFTLTHNDKEQYHLYQGNMKQRIVALFGNVYNERLLHVHQKTEIVSIEGYIGKPEFSRKTRGEQYFFVNKRYIRHPYLNHAIDNAFQELLPKDSFPTFFLNISIDPAEIDINIHPTKTEVNFRDTKLVYAILHGAVRKSIGQHNLTPRIDFDTNPDTGIDFGEISRANRPVVIPGISVNKEFNPFSINNPTQKTQNKQDEQWRVFYENDTEQTVPSDTNQPTIEHEIVSTTGKFIQINHSHIITRVRSGLLIIDQHLAHSRILYEKFLKQLTKVQPASQQELFPQNIQMNPGDADLLRELRKDLEKVGYVIEDLGQFTFVINGTPSGINQQDAAAQLEKILENYKTNKSDLHIDHKLNLATSMAATLSVKYGKTLQDEEMATLIDDLFACEVPETAPDGRKTLVILSMSDIRSKF